MGDCVGTKSSRDLMDKVADALMDPKKVLPSSGRTVDEIVKSINTSHVERFNARWGGAPGFTRLPDGSAGVDQLRILIIADDYYVKLGRPEMSHLDPTDPRLVQAALMSDFLQSLF